MHTLCEIGHTQFTVNTLAPLGIREVLAHKMYKNLPKSYSEFKNQCFTILNSFAPEKYVLIRGINKPHVCKKLRTAILKRAQFKNLSNLSRKMWTYRSVSFRENWLSVYIGKQIEIFKGILILRKWEKRTISGGCLNFFCCLNL